MNKFCVGQFVRIKDAQNSKTSVWISDGSNGSLIKKNDVYQIIDEPKPYIARLYNQTQQNMFTVLIPFDALELFSG